MLQLFASWNAIVLGAMQNAEDDAVPPATPPATPTSNTLAKPVVHYPFVGSGSRAGSFVMAYKRVDDPDWTLLPVTRRNLYPQELVINLDPGTGLIPPLVPNDVPRVPLSDFRSFGSTQHRAVTYMSVCHSEATDAFEMPAGTLPGWYDFCLLYDKGVASPFILQIVVGVRNLLIEVFPNSQ